MRKYPAMAIRTITIKKTSRFWNFIELSITINKPLNRELKATEAAVCRWEPVAVADPANGNPGLSGIVARSH